MSGQEPYPPRSINPPEKVAKRWIWTLSSIVLLTVILLGRV